MRWNPYFVAYAAAHGRTATQQHTLRGSLGFVLWMNERREEWCALHGRSYHDHITGRRRIDLPEEHFAGWLRGRAFAIAESLGAAA